jgi:CO dehydrogenase nickel-insertion accessory protein CooC1
LVAVANANYRQAHLSGAVFILNKVADERIEKFMRRRLAADGIHPIAVFHEEVAITECWLEGSPIFIPRLVMEAAHVVHQLESAEQFSHRTAHIKEQPSEIEHGAATKRTFV